MSDLKTRFPRYAKLLRFYPTEYRKRYEDELLQTTADMLDHASGRLERAGIWAQLAIDVPVSITKVQLSYIGGGMQTPMPSYIKRSSLIAALLLLPFFVAIAANGIDKLINNSTLYNSWVWNKPVIELWVFYLPAAALLVSIVSYALFVFRGADKHEAWVRRALDIVHSWPILAAGIVACGLLMFAEFHDTTQCVVHSPVHAMTHPSQTWRCVRANISSIPGA